MLHNLRVQNLRCFRDLSLELNPVTEDGSGWTILVGENGSGKSSLLQAMVIGLLDVRPVTNLVPDAWTFCRQGIEPSGTTAIEIAIQEGRGVEIMTKTIQPTEGAYFEQTGTVPEIDMTLAFSARRRIAQPDERPTSRNYELERVRGLFAVDHPLLAEDPFKALGTPEAQRKFARVVRDVVVHQLPASESRLFPLVDAMVLRGAGGVTQNQQLLGQRRIVLRYGSSYQARVGVQELSDGYQAMLAMVLEILVQATLQHKQVPNPANLRATILIDEIEAHLHPRWQRTVVDLLRDVFPRCQFVVTTHSPLVVASARPGEVHVLHVREEGDVEVDVLEHRLDALGAEDIYEEVFGVPRSAGPNYVESERTYLTSLAAEEPVDPQLAEYVESAWADATAIISARYDQA